MMAIFKKSHSPKTKGIIKAKPSKNGDNDQRMKGLVPKSVFPNRLIEWRG